MRFGRLLPLLAGLLLPAPVGARSPVAPATTSTPSGKAEPAPSRRTRAHSFVGEVVEILPSEKKLTARETLRDGSPKTTLFVLTPQTSVLRGKDLCSVSDIRVNDHVTIKYSEDAAGVHKALTIRVTPSAAPKP
jgi:hypothetical protein